MPFEYAVVAELMEEEPLFRPEIKGWNRLEGRPRNDDFERALRAEARDPLWFLTRQWQFGELRGEDAGSPIDARLVVEGRGLHRYRPHAGPDRPYDHATPLEATVEREPPPFDLVTHRQITQAIFRLMGPLGDLAAVRAGLVAAYPLTEEDIDGYLDASARAALLLAQPHVLNAKKLMAAIGNGSFDAVVDTIAAPTSRTAVKTAGAALPAWFATLYDLPVAGAAEAWLPERLEYRFACTVAAPDRPETVLAAESYDDGELDWWAFDQSAAHGFGPETTPRPAAARQVLSFIPAPVTFGGMPNPRFWEMEDRKTEFADIDSTTTDIAKILLTEFALIYANDWCLVPCEVAVGSLSRIAGLVVTDTFGERLLVRAAGRGTDEDWQNWRMFVLDTRQAGNLVEPELFLPPVTPKQMTGARLENVVFLRDEMANMAWAVEVRVPSALGRGADGYVVADESAPPSPPPPDLAEGVEVRYELGRDVPWNWRPFSPVHIEGSIRSIKLRRSRMPGPDRPIRGRILSVPSPYDLFEEEVPRAGTQVTIGFQRTRWSDGSIHLWLGRRASTGRGEGSSGLVFDQIRERGDERHIR
jgi:hypothetical protein